MSPRAPSRCVTLPILSPALLACTAGIGALVPGGILTAGGDSRAPHEAGRLFLQLADPRLERGLRRLARARGLGTPDMLPSSRRSLDQQPSGLFVKSLRLNPRPHSRLWRG